MLTAPDAYAGLFGTTLSSLPGHQHAEVDALRRENFERFLTLGFPGPKIEDWKYSPVGGLAREAMAPAPNAELGAGDIAPYLVDDDGVQHLVFVNGHFHRELSDAVEHGQGVAVATLGDALADGRIEPADLLREEDPARRGFSALNGAFADSGAVITVADGVRAERPVQLLFVSIGDERPTMANPRNLIRIGDGASLTLIETHLFRHSGRQLTNLVTTCSLGEGAEFRHDRLQIGDVEGSFVGRTEYRLAASAKLVQTLATLGGGFVRNEVSALLDGAQIEAQFNGLYLTRTGQHVDNMLQIDHAAPNSVSDQYYRGVLDGRAKAAFAGKIMVRRPAQQTNAFQTNNNLLLSADAEISTKPELEIYADDVKCSHGATAGELDEHALFYLRSRGFDAETARTMLTFAFADEVLERFASPAILGQAKREILRWLPGADILGDIGDMGEAA
jgi:Fe-S cluster assembly protein SufD